nr:MAG TPA: hypothetical protein [Caudoviricetes sp.]
MVKARGITQSPAHLKKDKMKILAITLSSIAIVLSICSIIVTLKRR